MKVITARAIVLYLYGLDLPVQPWPAHAVVWPADSVVWPADSVVWPADSVVWPADAVAVGCRCEYNTKSG